MSTFEPPPPSWLPPSPPAATVSPEQLPAPIPPAKKKSTVGMIVTVILLSLSLIGALAVLVIYIMELDDANARIADQQREIDEQQILIDEKETFGAAMEELLHSASEFNGALMNELVPFDDYETVAQQAWTHRWDGKKVKADTETVRTFTRELAALKSEAAAEASTNTTGSTYEAVMDSLGTGFVSSVIEDADTLCKKDVLACVLSDDPYTVHFDTGSNALPYMNEWIRTGVAYHEFAHVLQFTNPTPTAAAEKAFGGDWETMADCFALTYLNGWTLDHRVWVGTNRYWDVNIGYGYTCNESQRQVIRDWYSQLGFQSRSISQ